MGPTQRTGTAVAARLRRPGAGALERAHRTISRSLRGTEYAGVPREHTRTVLPPVAASDVRRRRPARHAQTTGHVHAQETVAPRARCLDGGRTHRGRLPRGARRNRRDRIRPRFTANFLHWA